MSASTFSPTGGCRICLKTEFTGSTKLIPVNNYSLTPTNTKETIKDTLLFCVPSLTLTDENKICDICLHQLKATYVFINKCLHAESVLSSSSDFNTTFESNDEYILENSLLNPNDEISKVKIEHGLTIPLDLHASLDYATQKFSIISATVDNMSSQQREDLLKMGINPIDMSTKSTGKKRIIYLARNYTPVDYDCSICGEKFNSSCDVLDHTRLHFQKRVTSTEGPSFSCDHCYQKFSVDEALNIHRLQVHNIKGSFSCARCKKKFKALSNLKRHEKIFKGLDKCAFKCPNQCSKEFNNRTTLEAHLKDVADAPCCDYVLCNVCSVKFTKEGFKEHSKIHKNYLCSECGKSFASRSSLGVHTSVVHKKSATMCHQCGKILKTRMGLGNHMRNAHKTDKDALTFICDQCPSTFRKKRRLRYHILIRHNSQPPKVKCTFCPKLFYINEQLRQHIRLIHEQPEKFKCNLCGCKFSRKDYFERHLKRHEIYSQFMCSVCKMCFASEARLKAHEHLGHDENGKALNYGHGGRGNTMKGPKPYTLSTTNQMLNKLPCICKICHKVVANMKTLRQHYKIHLRIRENKCEKCGLVMANVSSFSKHKKLHEDPNFDKRCKICYVTKSSKLELLEHMRTVHKNLKYECKYCGKKFGRKHLLYSHESLEHQEATERKKEALDIIYKEPVFVPNEIVVERKSRKGVKMTDYNSTDVDELITKISQGETAIQNSSDNADVLKNYELEEQERVCTELMEEIVYDYQYETGES